MLKYLFLAIPLIFFTSCANSSNKTQISKKCFELPGQGRCKAYFEKYYFDQKEFKCKKFVWGGCGGNIPFNSKNECKRACEK